MNDLPEPLTPADCNLRDFAFMPLDVKRLLSSETWVLGTGDERAAAITLWLESWHQVPAGSLPEADRMLGHLSQSKVWKKVKEHALRGWVPCSDGRLYHPVVSEKALEAWIEKLVSSHSGASGNAKRWSLEIDTAGTVAKIVHAVGLLKAIAPQSKTLRKKTVIAIVNGSHPDDKDIAPRLPESSPPDDTYESPPDIPPESPPDRNRQGHRQREGLVNHTHPVSPTAQISAVMRKFGIPANPAHPSVIAMAEQGIDLETLEAACQETRDAKPNEVIAVGYIVKKLEAWKEQASRVNVHGATKRPNGTPAWWLSNESMSAKASELGIPGARPGESPAAFRARIETAVSRGAK